MTSEKRVRTSLDLGIAAGGVILRLRKGRKGESEIVPMENYLSTMP
jgi:hypothetical protein